MEAVRTSETSVDNHFTWQYIPEDNSEHHTCRRENLKSHINYFFTILLISICGIGLWSKLNKILKEDTQERLLGQSAMLCTVKSEISQTVSK
jgi:hypothetical protein